MTNSFTPQQLCRSILIEPFIVPLLLSALLFSSFCSAENRYKIGLSLPLSGRLAHVGNDIRKGIELAVEDLTNDSIGFDLVYDDNRHEQKQAAASAHKLINVEQVDLIISLWDMADVIAPIAEDKQVPHIAIRWNPYITRRYKYTLTIETSYESYVDSQIKLLQLLDVHSVSLLSEENQGWLLAHDYFLKAVQVAGIKVLSKDLYSATDFEHRTLLQRALRKRPDIVVIFGNPPHTEILVQRIREYNKKQKITGHFESAKQLANFEGVPFVAQFEAESWFRKRFQKRWGEPFQARAPFGYDVILMLVKVNNNSSYQLGGAELMAQLSMIKNLAGASGLLSTNNFRNIENKPVWQIVKKGQVVRFSLPLD